MRTSLSSLGSPFDRPRKPQVVAHRDRRPQRRPFEMAGCGLLLALGGTWPVAIAQQIEPRDEAAQATARPAPWKEPELIKAQPLRGHAQFGSAVAVTGALAVIAADRDDVRADDAGAVYVFDLKRDILLHELFSQDLGPLDFFGSALAVEGNVVLISAPGAGGTNNTGAAYLFDLETGEQLRRLVPNRPSNRSDFGVAVALDGNRAAVGSPEDRADSPSLGAVYLFDIRTGDELVRLTGDPSEEGGFGASVAMDRGSLVVGHPLHDEIARDAGAAYFFSDPESGVLTHTLLPADGQIADFFGTAVGIGDAFIVVGSPRNPEYAPDAGAAYVFDVRTGELLYKFIPPDPARPLIYFGSAVAMDGGLAVIGGYLSALSGSAFVLDVPAGAEQAELRPIPGGIDPYFGDSVTIDEHSMLIGSPRADVDEVIDAGLVYHYRREHPRLSVTTTDRCPGPVTVKVRNASWGGRLRVVYGTEVGAYQLSSGSCWGTYLSLHPPFEPVGPGFVTADATGNAELEIEVPADLCGGLALQVIDLTTCETSRLLNIESGIGTLSVLPSPLLAGQPVYFELAGLTSESAVWMLYSLTGINPQGTPIAALNVIVDLANPLPAWGPKVATADGTLDVEGLVPIVTSDRDIWFQAVQEERITNFVASRLLRQ